MKKLGFGMMRLPQTDERNSKSVDIEQFKKMVDIFLERGFTYFDTAYPYHQGKSETAFRATVAERYPREAYTITDKMPVWMIHNEHDYANIFKTQLERCGVEYFDYYWLHCLTKDSLGMLDRTKGWEFLSRMKEEGKARHIGFSFHDDAATLEKILKEHPEAEYVQLQINYVDWYSPNVQAGECYKLCEKYGRKVIVMEPVKGGSLAKVPQAAEDLFKEHAPEASVASWAIRYVASLPNVMMVLSGMSDLAQTEDNTSYMQDFKPLDADEQAIVAQAAEIIKNSIAIPCTACHYCTDGCPMNIAIPEYFSLYNTVKQFGASASSNSFFYFNRLASERGKPSDCIECGQCESHCPQHLPIIDNLKLVSGVFER